MTESEGSATTWRKERDKDIFGVQLEVGHIIDTIFLFYNICSVTDYNYTAIFLTNGLCIVYCSLLQCLTLVYPGWGQKSEFFCLLVTTRRLWSGTVVGYRSTTTAYCWYTVLQRAIEVHQGKGQSKVPCHCLPGGHIQGH